ncbi:MAG: glycosyltransferase [Oscillospiraceae bacterium]|nr:glycosyltransferase [Oscillospiraceae bacterium]
MQNKKTDKTLNVCLINDSFPPAIDGVANAVTNYAKIIARDYGSPTVVTPWYPNADDSVYDFPVVRYPSVDMTKLVGYRAGMPFSPEIAARLEQAEFDIIHSHCPITSTMLARSVRERLDVPVVFTYHTKFDIDIANAIRFKLLQDGAAKILAENISACDEVWTVSRGAGENLRKLGYRGEYTVMPNGVDFPQGRVSDELIRDVTGAYDLPEGLPLFLFVGRMMWYKGIRITLDALKLLQEQGKDFRMVFVGGGTDRSEIADYCHSLGLDGKVFFVDPIRDRDRIRAWYCRADLFLFPSTFDTNGLVVREAAACGLGSVLVAESCAAEDVTDGRDGFLIEENAESMAACLEELCNAPEKMKEVGANAQRDIYISWDTAVRGAVERYHTVIENYRTGLYPKHENAQDSMLNGIGELMRFIGTSESRRQTIRSYLNDVTAGKRTAADWRHPFDASVTDAVFRSMKSGFAEWKTGILNRKEDLQSLKTGLENRKEDLQSLMAELEARRTELEENLESYFDIFL